MIKQSIWIILTSLIVVTIAFAQENCSLTQEQLLSAFETCENAEIGTVCYGSGELSLESDADEIEFASIEDTALLAETIAIETASDDSMAIIYLNREDAALKMLAIGQTKLENTAPRTTINVYSLRGVNVRQEPSLDATVIGSLVQGRDYTAVGRLADNTWIQVQLEDGRIGWSSAQYFVTQDGFTELEAVTPTAPPYLPMQSLTLSTEDCGALLLIAPEIEEETVIFGINGAQIQVRGIVWIQVVEDLLTISSIDGEQVVNAFGFEMPIESGEMTTITLSDSNSIAGIPSDATESDQIMLDEETIELLLEEK